MKIGFGITVVTELVVGEGNNNPSPPVATIYYFSDNALTQNYYFDDALTERYAAG